MTTPLSLAVRQARLLAVRDFLDMGELRFYTGLDAPATPETATLETLLGSVILDTVVGSIGASGQTATLTLTVPRTGAVVATGLIGWVRFVDTLGNGIMDRLVVELGTAGPVVVSDKRVYLGGELQLISCVISE